MKCYIKPPEQKPEIEPPPPVPGWPLQEPPGIRPGNDPEPAVRPHEVDPMKPVPEIKPDNDAGDRSSYSYAFIHQR